MNLRFDVCYGIPIQRPSSAVQMLTDFDPPTLLGYPVRVSDLAVRVEVSHMVERIPRRRRRAYRVRRIETRKPCAMRLSLPQPMLVIHPEIWRALQAKQQHRWELASA